MLNIAIACLVAAPFLSWPSLDNPTRASTPPPAVPKREISVVDNADTGYMETQGSWFVSALPGLVGDSRYSTSANAVARFSFGPRTGVFEISASWPSHSNSSKALYLVECGGTLVGSAIRNQANAGGDYVSLGTVVATGGELVVTVSQAPGGAGALRTDVMKISDVSARDVDVTAIIGAGVPGAPATLATYLLVSNTHSTATVTVEVSVFTPGGTLRHESDGGAAGNIRDGGSPGATFQEAGPADPFTFTVTISPKATAQIDFYGAPSGDLGNGLCHIHYASPNGAAVLVGEVRRQFSTTVSGGTCNGIASQPILGGATF